MTREAHGMHVKWSYVVYGTTMYQVNKVETPFIGYSMILLQHFHIPTYFEIQNCNVACYHKEGEPMIFNVVRGYEKPTS
jgi:hypothetical protein